MTNTSKDANLLAILRVCQEMKEKGIEPLAGKWIRWECERRGISFHSSRLGKLVRMGCLEKGKTSRRGNRRYYRVIHAELVKPTPNPLGFPPQPRHPEVKPPLGPNPGQ
jgi:hypothetical protein